MIFPDRAIAFIHHQQMRKGPRFMKGEGLDFTSRGGCGKVPCQKENWDGRSC